MKNKTYKHILTLLFLLPLLYIQQATGETHPGTMEYSTSLKHKMITAVESKGSNYEPRTSHLTNGQPTFTNRLIFEDSPYLLQHAHNPVNWYPWGEEAFLEAKKQNKPVFLSIGYATCHWCHVMEEESFENKSIAKILNENFIAIKVDREQYPDVDETYMAAVMLMTGNGGWPMSSFLLPDSRPFFGGTYFPPANFSELLSNISHIWHERKSEIIDQAEELSNAVKKSTSTQHAVQRLGRHSIQQAVNNILERYDAMNGGFTQAPKFPNEASLLLLLRTTHKTEQSLALKAALEHTLKAMAQGGIYDQIGGGFHRYSTDSQWLVPHFEKMLYNQAYLARVYTEAWRQFGDPLYARTARQTLDYVLREMAGENGGFFSATDADSEGEEGTYFIWTEKEIRELLNVEDADFVIRLYGISKKGNFEGKNILFLPQSLVDIAQQENLELSVLFKKLDRINKTLRKTRQERIPPLTDNKIIVAWNGMLICALVEAADIFGDEKYLSAAVKSAEFLWHKQRTEQGGLLRVNLDGRASIGARQDDYAHFGEALLALYDISSEKKWLDRAQQITDEMIVKFEDKESAAFVMGNDPILFTQPKSTYDGATPSGNSVAVRLLSRLAARSGEFKYKNKANDVLETFSGAISEYPSSYAYMLAQLDELRNGEIGNKQYAARGAIKIKASIRQVGHQYSLRLKLDIVKGWHINSNKPLHKELIATQVSIDLADGWKLVQIEYPTAKLKKLDLDEQPLSLFQGNVQIKAKLLPKNKPDPSRKLFPITASVQLQACNEQACLPPETVKLSITLIGET